MINVSALDDQINQALKDSRHEQREDETQLLNEVFKNMGGEPTVPRQDISALDFNESQFNGPDDSRINDVFEMSRISKPSIIGRMFSGEKNMDNSHLNVYKHKTDIQELKAKIFGKDPNTAKDPKPTIFDNLQNFPELDTSGIDVDATHHIDKDFDDEDNEESFMATKTLKQDSLPIGNIFGARPSPIEPGNLPITPQMGMGGVSCYNSNL